MGEIDTKSIESVQAALSLFGEKSSDKKKNSFSSCINEMEKEKDIGSVLRDLANLKIQVEAKDSAHKQVLLKLDHHENTADEHCSLLMSSELEKEIYMIECRGLRIHVVELESRIQEMADQILEYVKTGEQLSHAISELKSKQGELLIAERELVAARDAKLEALTQVEVMESALSMEKLKTEELLRNVSKLNESVSRLSMTATEAEENTTLLYERGAELELEAANAKEEVEFLRNQLEIMQDLEKELLDKSVLIDSMKVQLQQVNELRASSEKVTSDVVCEVKKLKEDLELQERKNWDQSGYVSLLESELRQLKGELNKANEEATRANADVETISLELEQFKKEMVGTREKESEAQVEIAFLQSELHKGRSKIAAAEVADSVAKSEKSALHLALQQLALEAEEAKKENKRLKEASEETQNEEPEEGKGETKAYITIPREEYEQLIKKKEPVYEEPNEMQVLKKELKTATVKINELRTRAEQAISRAEAAEKGKAGLEDQIKRWKEHKERKKAALAALREESISREITEYKADTTPKTLQPLGKVLRMKF
ncbi:WEB family protein At5g55860-like [Nicotiana tomentosiformis]|uniref:WEB family protein At5g55860-like n=1 Tax=Nicotiana tomentosiformis TaxID=4098 RepID=UPI00051BAA4F|nr:protein WEAK CHLOROPLAST MOVEMENT UNDER BLUE LIGHT-like 3 isoform X1 [Nicotiana tomentosiformis]